MTALTKARFALADALSVAHDLVAELTPACERIVIAGSIRRKIQWVSDIEIVALPKWGGGARDLFDGAGAPVDLLDQCVRRLVAEGVVASPPPTAAGRAAPFGPRLKRLVYQRMPVDLFVAHPLQWGVILALRTGPADYSHQLVTHHGGSFRDRTGARRAGLLPRHLRVRDGALLRVSDGGIEAIIETPTEEAFFAAIGVDYVQPWSRQ